MRVLTQESSVRGEKELTADNFVPGRHAQIQRPGLLSQREALSRRISQEGMPAPWLGLAVWIDLLVIYEEQVGPDRVDTTGDRGQAAVRDNIISVQEPEVLAPGQRRSLIPGSAGSDYLLSMDHPEPALRLFSLLEDL